MGRRQERDWLRGVAAGVIGGLAASWVMNVFIAEAGPGLTHAVQSEAQNRKDEQATPSTEPKIDATMKTADAVVHLVTGGQHLSVAEMQKDGPVVHYAFGALMGALYGVLAESSEVVTTGFGTGFGAALFIGADVVAVPMLNLSGAATDGPVGALATPLAAHLVYGATTELVRRMVRRMLSAADSMRVQAQYGTRHGIRRFRRDERAQRSAEPLPRL